MHHHCFFLPLTCTVYYYKCLTISRRESCREMKCFLYLSLKEKLRFWTNQCGRIRSKHPQKHHQCPKLCFTRFTLPCLLTLLSALQFVGALHLYSLSSNEYTLLKWAKAWHWKSLTKQESTPTPQTLTTVAFPLLAFLHQITSPLPRFHNSDSVRLIKMNCYELIRRVIL